MKVGGSDEFAPEMPFKLLFRDRNSINCAVKTVHQNLFKKKGHVCISVYFPHVIEAH